MPAPVLLAPVGVQSIIHPEGELAVARAAAGQGVPMVASTASSFTLEEIAEAGRAVDPDAPRWFQLYWPKDPDLMASFIAPRRGRGLRGAGRHARHAAAGLAPARPATAPTCRS